MTSIRTAVAGMAVLVVCMGSVARAEMSDSEKYFTIGSVQILDEGVVNTPSLDDVQIGIYLPKGPNETPAPADPIDEANVILDKIINMGKKVWTLVEAGRPVVNFSTNVATGLPQGLTRWDQLSDWQAPQAHVYRAVYKNVYGAKVVDFSYRVLYTAGGSLNGKGRFLSQVTVVPGDLNVAWGYTFNADVTVPNLVNTGTSADPVAGMELLVHWKVNTVMKHSESTTSYFVQGDGSFKDLTNGN